VPEQRQRTVVVQRTVPETRQVTREYTVAVPETRTRTVEYNVCRTVWREEQREYTVQVPYEEEVEAQRMECRLVPTPQTITVMVPETRTRTVNYTVCRPTWREEEVEYTVQVPHREVREGVRQECRLVPVTVQRTVCRDQGSWQQVICDVPSCGHPGCNACCHRQFCRNVWVPNIVEEQVPVTVHRSEVVEVPYQYHVTVCRPETRTRVVRIPEMVEEQQSREVQFTVCVPQEREITVQRTEMVSVPYRYTVTRCRPQVRTATVRVPEVVTETQSREVQYTVCVPQTRSETYDVTTYRCVPEEQVVNYTVMVPRKVERQVQVRVCRMVPRTITERVPVSQPCATGCY
jgi:hypothetical protein